MVCLSLSVVIITKNEEANLARTLRSVAWADEIVVVDSGSTDRTREIAESFHAKFFVEEWKGFAAQKNSGLQKASGDWVLSLDADEAVDPVLAEEIRRTFVDLDEVEKELKKAAKAIDVVSGLTAKYRARLQALCDTAADLNALTSTQLATLASSHITGVVADGSALTLTIASALAQKS